LVPGEPEDDRRFATRCRLAETQQIAVLTVAPGTPLALQVGDVWSAADGGKVDAVATEGNVVLRVARVYDEARRRRGHALLDEAAVEAHDLAFVIHLGTGGGEDVERFRQQEGDAEFFENAQRRQMDLLNLIGGQRLDGSVGIHQIAPRQLMKALALAALPATAVAIARPCHVMCLG
jgi:hypothetical protein